MHSGYWNSHRKGYKYFEINISLKLYVFNKNIGLMLKIRSLATNNSGKKSMVLILHLEKNSSEFCRFT